MSIDNDDFDVIPDDLGPPRDLKPRRNNFFASPAFRVGLVLIVCAVAGIIGLGMWSGGQETETVSNIGAPSSVKDTPGTEVTPAYADAVRTRNSQRLEEALVTGESAIPTPVVTPSALKEGEQNAAQIDPVRAFEGAEANGIVPEAPLPPAPAPDEALGQTQQQVPVQQYSQQFPQQYAQQGAVPQGTVDPAALASAMQNQMQTLLQGWTPQPANVVTVTTSEIGGGPQGAYGSMIPGRFAGAGFNATQLNSEETATQPKEEVIVPAGTRFYAELETEANSDVPTPVIARILTGPLEGARAIGTFESTDDHLVIEFTTVARGDEEYDVQAIAIDPETKLSGLATDTDKRYFQRVLLPTAAAFIQGFGEAFADSRARTTTYVGDFVVEEEDALDRDQQIAKGVAEGAETASELIEDEASTIRPLVRVRAGTAIGILFVSSVREGR